MSESDPLIRHWDPKGEYEGAVLKVYPHWCLEVSWNQHTLGSYIIFCRREGVKDFSEMNEDEASTFPRVCEDMKVALLNNPLFRPKKFNHSQMGNKLPMLHIHGIPRYDDRRYFGNEEWNDDTPGDLPRWSYLRRDAELIRMLVEAIRPHLPNHA